MSHRREIGTVKEPLATPRLLSRRQALARLGVSGAALVAGRVGAASSDNALPACVVRPRQTEGPFFVDGEPERSDLRVDSRTGAVKPGVPLRLAFRVSRVVASSCAPLSGAQVHVWHCDAAGSYSSVRERRSPSPGEAYLRGFQNTDAAGTARFLTIYPGWYPGRAVHVHFKIRIADAGGLSEFTSQLYFDDALSRRVYAAAPYASRGAPEFSNRDDFLFRGGGAKLLLDVTPTGEGYAAVFDIGLQA